jgi:mono/diheme cytochrome c family protein
VLLFAMLLFGGCSQPEPPEPALDLALVDSLLTELGGTPAADLGRGQRWRMISSIGTGLPPSSFNPENLPEPNSRGAQLVKAYCVQCHWIPVPQMHTAAEWPVLVRGMLARARTLENRMGGPLTEGLVGEILLDGMTSTQLPSPQDADTLLAYMERHAIVAASPDELTDGPGADLFIEQCSFCHDTPSPAAHSAAEWNGVVVRMQANMAAMGVEPLTSEQSEEIAAYLRSQVGASNE